MAKSRVKQLVAPFIVRRGDKFRLDDIDPDATAGLHPSKRLAKELLQEGVDRLCALRAVSRAQWLCDS